MTSRYIQDEAFTVPSNHAVASKPRAKANSRFQWQHKTAMNLLPASFPSPQQGAERSPLVQPMVTGSNTDTPTMLFFDWDQQGLERYPAKGIGVLACILPSCIYRLMWLSFSTPPDRDVVDASTRTVDEIIARQRVAISENGGRCASLGRKRGVCLLVACRTSVRLIWAPRVVEAQPNEFAAASQRRTPTLS